MNDKNKKTMLITGVTRGLGLMMLEGFSELGHTVLGCGRSKESIEKLQGQYPSPHHFSVVDVAQDQSVENWSKEVLKQYGPPDFILNNAALMNELAPLWEVPEKEFSKLIDVNIKGVFSVIRHFVPAMVEARKGVVINFSSGWGHSTSPEVAPYCTSKWAIEGMSQAMSQEVPNGVAVIALSPGVINTEMLQTAFGAEGAAQNQSPEAWKKKAIPYILNLSAKDNGKSLRIG